MNGQHGNPGEADTEFDALRVLSARLGRDPLLIQAAGGNTSIKTAGLLHIKASGTWLSEAEDRDIFVPVDIAPLRNALDQNSPDAEKPIAFVPEGRNPHNLRPSIETTVHAVFNQRVVLHVHCVNTIAIAVRHDAEAELGMRLDGLNWVFVPYHRPGAPLARAIADRVRPETDVVVLGNHGLIVAADSVAGADALLADVVSRVSREPPEDREPDLDALRSIGAGSGFEPAGEASAHQVALHGAATSAARKGSLYPDHVIFLGVGSDTVGPDETVLQAVSRVRASGLPEPAMLLVPGCGVLLREDANAGARAMARCLSDVTLRVPADASLSYLTRPQNLELLNWDAEKYRQALNAG